MTSARRFKPAASASSVTATTPAVKTTASLRIARIQCIAFYRLAAPLLSNSVFFMARPSRVRALNDSTARPVISVRVKVKAGSEMMSFDGDMPSPPNSQMQRFFHHFGVPEGEIAPDDQGQRHDQFVTGQGSGFFITADGYAVTNNHVVDKAKAVEITTDDGKTYDAKVIGTDPRTDLALIKVDGRNEFPFVR